MRLLKSVKLILLFVGYIVLSGFIVSSTDTGSTDNQMNIPKPFSLIVIDPGHGGLKLGAVGKISKEKDVVLDVSKKLKIALEKEFPGIKVLLTRDIDIDVAFHERTALANKNHADLFMSIHCNSADSERKVRGKNGKYTIQTTRRPNVLGTETFVCGFNKLDKQDVAIRENADMLLEENYQENYQGFDPNDPSTYMIFQLMKRQYRDQSIKFASYIQEEYIKSGRINRGVQELPLAVLQTAAMPAVLTEIGFISNPEEEIFMLSDEGQKQIVDNLVKSIKRFKESTERPAN